MTRIQQHQLDERRSRALTDADVQALANEMERRLANRFYLNLGRGFWGLVWKGIIVILIGISTYGVVRGIK